jgi:hypothetical protein
MGERDVTTAWRPTRRSALIGAGAAGLGGAALAAPWGAGARFRDRIGAGVGIGPSPAFARAADLGFRLGRTSLMWDWVELSKGGYDWARYDQQFPQMQAAGLRPMAIITPNNTRYAEAGWPVSSAEAMAALARFSALAAERFRRFDPIFELSNEPNYPDFWKPAPNPAHYVAIARRMAEGVLSVNPGATLIAGSLSGVAAPTRAFLEQCLDLGLGQLADAIGVHPYLNPPEKALDEYIALRRLIARYPGRRGPLRIVQTEWAYPAHTIPDAEAYAAMTARIMLVDAMAGADATIYYRLEDVDPAATTDAYEANYGLLRHQGQLKSGARLIARLLAAIGDATRWRAIDAGPGVYTLRFTGPGLPQARLDRVVAWAPDGPREAVIPGVNQDAPLALDPTPKLV